MIEMPKKIFQIPNEAYTKCQFTKTDYSVSLTLNEVLGSYSQSMLNMYLNDRIDEMIKVILIIIKKIINKMNTKLDKHRE